MAVHEGYQRRFSVDSYGREVAADDANAVATSTEPYRCRHCDNVIARVDSGREGCLGKADGPMLAAARQQEYLRSGIAINAARLAQEFPDGLPSAPIRRA